MTDTPAWYDALDETARWAVQARFWSAIAKTCRSSPAVFCYDLMNEPIIDGKRDQGWLAGCETDLLFAGSQRRARFREHPRLSGQRRSGPRAPRRAPKVT